jgi:glycosyltransferase 2 family protein
MIWALIGLDWGELKHRIAAASVSDLLVMLLFWMVALFVRPLRFCFLLRALGEVPRARYLDVWASTTVGMAVNSFTAMRAGDVVVTLLLRHRVGIDMHQSLTVMAADALCDFAFIAVLFLAVLAFSSTASGWSGHAAILLALIMFLVVAGLAATMRLRDWLQGLIDRLAGRIDRPWAKRLREISHDMLLGAASIAHWRVSLPLLALTAGIWVIIGASYWMGLRAVSIEPTMARACFTMAAVTLSFIVPLGPGGLGAFETAAVVALSVFGVPLEAAIPFAIVAHAFQLASVLFLAAIAVTVQKIDYRSLLSATSKSRSPANT